MPLSVKIDGPCVTTGLVIGHSTSSVYHDGVIYNVRVGDKIVLNEARFKTLTINGYVIEYTGNLIKRTTLNLDSYKDCVITIERIESVDSAENL